MFYGSLPVLLAAAGRVGPPPRGGLPRGALQAARRFYLNIPGIPLREATRNVFFFSDNFKRGGWVRFGFTEKKILR